MFKLDYVNTKKAKKKLFMDTLFRIFVVFFLGLCVFPKIISQFVFFGIFRVYIWILSFLISKLTAASNTFIQIFVNCYIL